eukprot:CAMPEP_0113941076 /NCGR_PEP_ID=MMETSP1339-20121228/7076_1 /TAXON_ID=94617 /ORGANISM="Fibrocapsa japonica" /LENGTH=270 /DNA_ID=CAMNT_0000945119 /DNA_START=175 /DNA_END=987 /DNA_ORIENTATION=- /assembly_acc=CAM_ASM_000762
MTDIKKSEKIDTLLKKMDDETKEALAHRLERVMTPAAKEGRGLTEEERDILLMGCPKEVRTALDLIAMNTGEKLTMEELIKDLPDELKARIDRFTPENREIFEGLQKELLRKMKGDMTEHEFELEVRQALEGSYQKLFAEEDNSEDKIKETEERLQKTLDKIQKQLDMVKARVKKEGQAYEEELIAYKAARAAMDNDPVLQIRLFPQKNILKKSALVASILLLNNAVYQIIKTIERRGGNVQTALGEIALVGGLLFVYGLFGKPFYENDD